MFFRASLIRVGCRGGSFTYKYLLWRSRLALCPEIFSFTRSVVRHLQYFFLLIFIYICSGQIKGQCALHARDFLMVLFPHHLILHIHQFGTLLLYSISFAVWISAFRRNYCGICFTFGSSYLPKGSKVTWWLHEYCWSCGGCSSLLLGSPILLLSLVICAALSHSW